MNVDAVSLFLALLAVVAQVGTVGMIVGLAIPSLRPRVVATLGPVALTLAATVAVVSTAGSLYFSEVAHFTPCRLCWYQRIAMYPLAVILPIAAAKGDGLVRRYVTPLAAIGAVIAGYHILVERFPNLETSACDPLNPCSLVWIERLGYLTIPTMALSGFAAILALLGVRARWDRS